MLSSDGGRNLISRKVRCQQAYDSYFKSEKPVEEYIIMKLSQRIRKHGINWAIGDLADFRLKNPDIAEKMQKLTQKIRVMIPLNEFNVHNNSNARGRQNLISDRGSGSSTASNLNQ